MNYSSIQPGNMIEWVCYDNSIIRDKELWSTLIQQWVPIGIPALLIGNTRNKYYWLTENGFYYAYVDDAFVFSLGALSVKTVRCIR